MSESIHTYLSPIGFVSHVTRPSNFRRLLLAILNLHSALAPQGELLVSSVSTTRNPSMKDPEDCTIPVEPSHASNMTAPTTTASPSLVQLDNDHVHPEMSQWKVKIRKLPKELRDLVAGGVAGMIAKSVVAPIDRIKILYQISAVEFHLHKVPNVVRKIVETEGVAALWKGNLATMIRVFPYAGIQFMVFARCKTYFLREHQRDHDAGSIVTVDHTSHHSHKYGLTPLESLVAGMVAGAISATATYPLDLTRAQLAVLRRHRHHHNLSFVQVFGDNVRKRVSQMMNLTL
jgi:hypothetical protein